MAIQNVLISYTLQDADGDQASLPTYGTYDDASVTLADIVSYAGANAALLDAITDVKINKMAVTIFPALPGGLKADPVAGSDVEKTAVLTLNLDAPAGKAYTQDIPGFYLAGFTGDEVNKLAAAVEDWVNQMKSAITDVKMTNNFWTSKFTGLRRGFKSMRKLGR